MLRVRRPRITSSNYVGDTVTVRFRNEIQANLKQLNTAFGVDQYVPGNYLPDTAIPTLSQYVAMYATARVVRSTIKVTFTNIEATYSKTVGVTQLPINDATMPPPSTTVYYSEQPRTKSVYLTPLSGSKSSATILSSGSTRTAYGSGTSVTSESDILSTNTLTTSPADAWGWSVWTQNVAGAGTTETAGTNVRVLVWYTIQFLNRKQQAA